MSLTRPPSRSEVLRGLDALTLLLLVFGRRALGEALA
jgi:hypothetical protein